MLLNNLSLALFTMATASATALPPPTASEAQSELQRLIASNSAVPAAKLSPLWSALPPIPVSKAIGTYKGGLFVAPGTPSAINWFGKQIISEASVNPLLSNAPNNTSIVFPYPRKDIAQARNVEHEGVVSAAIIYNRLPLIDYLRVVKHDEKTGELVLLGKSDLLGKAAEPPYFWLRRQEGVKIDWEFKNPYPNSSGF